MDKIGIYVGSFNPPHLGHEKIIKYLLEKNIVDYIYIVPVSHSLKKLISNSHRYNMLKLLAIKNTTIITDALEYNHHFDYKLLNNIKNKYDIKNSYIILGIDNLNKMNSWKNYNEIMAENKIICIKRNNEQPLITNNIIFIDNISSISSTKIRTNIEENKDNLNQKIYKYIIDNNLYSKKGN